ncbi:hypothetical protein NQ314_018178 [Rhamnusium bicolor]|uniref:HTH psq-type domain-containing protein n=1 Tax=Rhamnusium bicolor TaxID=1586634 RepID=A0AAV8WR14_9CUCU|nr:hypothetical protein NQ314_018178 [Rhamnusium bicolor]
MLKVVPGKSVSLEELQPSSSVNDDEIVVSEHENVVSEQEDMYINIHTYKYFIIMSKRKHNTLNLEEKVKILKLIESGESFANIASKYGVGKSTVGDIKKEQDKNIGKDDFKASSGWLQKFKKRFGIRQLTVSGELLSSDFSAVEPFKEKL